MSQAGTERGGGGGLRAAERLSILMRSFLIQSVWNARGMQNVGFCFAMLPLVRRLDDTDAVRGYLKRHLELFNTNPALSCYALGAAAAAEASGEPERAVDAKRALAGPLGMAGDSLMWGALRPLAAVVGASLALAGRAWAPLALVAVYNVPHLALRARGIVAGAAGGPSAAREVLGRPFCRVVTVVRAGGALGAGFVLAMAVSGGEGVTLSKVAVSGALFVLVVAALRLRIPLTLIGAGGAVGGVALMLLAAS
jgi:mannose/fructose/N-acetylgalactosamine-specific phosphotransferase system component IID